MNQKKVLFISSSSIHTKKFIDMLEDDVEVYLLTNRDIEIFEGSKIKHIYLWKKNKIKNIFYTFKILNKIKPNFITIQQIGPVAFFYTLLLHKKYKILVTSWGSDIMIYPYRSFLSMFMTKYTLSNASYLSSINSIGMISVLKSLSSFSKEIIPINFGISQYIQFEREFHNKENIIFSPRSHKDLYNIEQIIYSFAEFSKNEPTWRLYLSGIEDPVNTPKYKQLIKTLNIEKQVQFLGYLSQKENAIMFNKSKIVVSVPFSDGRPISVMEAIASNCIVICSDILANHELIQDSLNGFIIDHTKRFDMSIWKNLDIDLMTKYNQKISKSFSFDTAKKEYKKLLQGLLNDNDNW